MQLLFRQRVSTRTVKMPSLTSSCTLSPESTPQRRSNSPEGTRRQRPGRRSTRTSPASVKVLNLAEVQEDNDEQDHEAVQGTGDVSWLD